MINMTYSNLSQSIKLCVSIGVLLEQVCLMLVLVRREVSYVA